jgi:rod shape-determining protein MreD
LTFRLFDVSAFPVRWISFTIVLLLVTALQKTVAPFIAVHTIRPDLMVVFAVYCALTARTYDALLACWFIGLAMDLSSLSFVAGANVGLHACALGLIGLLIVSLRDLTFRESIVTQLFFTFVAKMLLAVLTGAHLLYVVKSGPRLGEVLLCGLYSAVYTVALAPYGHWAFRRLRNVLGIGLTHRLRMR